MNISVRVVKRSRRKYYQAEWVDPVTGRDRTKSTKCTKKRDAERFAGQLEEKLSSGEFHDDKPVTWDEFRLRYMEDVAVDLADNTNAVTRTVFNHVENVLEPHLASGQCSSQRRLQTCH